jgi:hypothetical protein
MNRTKFASGWVRAELIDSLGTRAAFKDGEEQASVSGDGAAVGELGSGRRMVMFGPEGFREAPRDHRLVMVMGADPSAFFAAMDDVLGTVAEVEVERESSKAGKELMARMERLRQTRDRVQAVMDDLNADITAAGK